MDRSIVEQIVQSIVEFLRSELAQGDSALEAESAESVEVAVQCLETAYHLQSTSSSPLNLYDVYRKATAAAQSCSSSSFAASQCSGEHIATAEEKAQAEQCKTEGNNKMREEKFSESVTFYTQAIEKDPSNAVYYCNRAAAHSKLNNQTEAIRDCQQALQLQPDYSKAYGRMGLAHSSLEQHREARDCYKRALELEPDNEGYARNLTISEEKLQNSAAPTNPLATLLGGGGGLSGLSGAFTSSGAPDLSALLANPAIMNMATQLMSDPNMQNIMTNILGSTATAAPATTAAAPPPAPSTTSPSTAVPPAAPAPPPATAATPPDGFPGIDALLTAGRQLAEQMQSQHPELLQQLRSHMDGQQPPQP